MFYLNGSTMRRKIMMVHPKTGAYESTYFMKNNFFLGRY